MRPLNSVNDCRFAQLVKTLEPRYNMESRTYITSTLIPQMYDDLKAKIQQDLNACEFVGLTTDQWTSRATQSFTTVTALYINDHWELKNVVLVTKEFGDSQTANKLSDDFETFLQSWKLSKTNITVMTDNAANITLAMKKCSIKHVRCMAHTLNLSSQKAL